MCIFSGDEPVRVEGTRIFGRVDQARQCIVYSMHVAAPQDVAMILPIPVVPGSGDAATTFVDLSEHPKLFDELSSLFTPPSRFEAPLGEKSARVDLALAVHEVGAFVASYVPSIADFARLDPRFQLPDTVWSALPSYRDYGFAVFQLKPGDARVHPMAFHFATRDPSRVFFPTVHVHDGAVHPSAAFDHELYWQGSPGPSDETSWVAYGAVGAEKSKGLVLPSEVRRLKMRGTLANADVWI